MGLMGLLTNTEAPDVSRRERHSLHLPTGPSFAFAQQLRMPPTSVGGRVPPSTYKLPRKSPKSSRRSSSTRCHFPTSNSWLWRTTRRSLALRLW